MLIRRFENLKMKRLILFLFVLAIIGSTYASGDKRLEFSVKQARKDTSHPGAVRVKLELKNLTDSTLTFLTDGCGHQTLFTLEGDSLFIGNLPNCIWLGISFIKVLPHDTYEETIYVETERKNANFQPFRVRINLREPKKKSNLLKAYKEKKPKQFSFWADYITIK